jgi:elongation factor Ts
MSNNIKEITELRERTSLPLKDCAKALNEAGNVEDAIVLLKKWGELKGKEKAHKIATEGVVKTFCDPDTGRKTVVELNSQTDFCSRSKEFNELLNMFGSSDFDETKFESARHELIAKSGENIVLRRKDEFEHTDDGDDDKTFVAYVSAYDHPGNKLAVLVDVRAYALPQSNEAYAQFTEFADDIAMQIAAMAPVVVDGAHLSTELLASQRAIFEGQLAEEKKPEAAWPKIIEGKFAKWRKDVCLVEQESIKEAKKSVAQVLAETEKKLGCTLKITRFVRYALGEGQVVAKDNLADEVGKMIG